MHRFLALAAVVIWSAAGQQLLTVPRIWTDRALADWATPVAGLNVRPAHISEREYYATPVAEWVRTYPVYFPGREPAGYFERISQLKPEPLITPRARTPSEWIAVGKQVFREMDVAAFRSYDPKLIALVRSAVEYSKVGAHPQKDGTIQGLRWVPTAKGLALSITDCAGCHTRVMPDGSLLDGAPSNDGGDGAIRQVVQTGVAAFSFGESAAVSTWRAFSVPWIPNDIHNSIKAMNEADLGALFGAAPPGTSARFNGSPFYVTKVPDLIGIKDRKYLDATATHRARSPEDVMRYAIVVSCCDNAIFGTHHTLLPQGEKPIYRFPDELLYALAQYIYSLEPPPNPNPNDARAFAGKKVFDREGCGGCHPAPLYTSNKLTLAQGYTPPKDHPLAADIVPISVGTDPNLALKTRKGTGFYKVPSLKNVWYRGLLSHDGSVATLEDWFNPARLRDDYVPTGFKGYKVDHRAISGHEFGLKLSDADRAALIAFLRTL
jgi:hypothetical protein